MFRASCQELEKAFHSPFSSPPPSPPSTHPPSCVRPPSCPRHSPPNPSPLPQELEKAFRLFDWSAYNERFDVSWALQRLALQRLALRSLLLPLPCMLPAVAVAAAAAAATAACHTHRRCRPIQKMPLLRCQVPWGAKETALGMVGWCATFAGVGLAFVPLVGAFAPNGFSGMSAADKSLFALVNQVRNLQGGVDVAAQCHTAT